MRAADARRGASAPGRTCPVAYRYPPTVFRRAPDVVAAAIYVVGGLYGNVEALQAVEALAAAEGATLVFNGDFHWFDVERADFAAIEAGTAPHARLRGNVARMGWLASAGTSTREQASSRKPPLLQVPRSSSLGGWLAAPTTAITPLLSGVLRASKRAAGPQVWPWSGLRLTQMSPDSALPSVLPAKRVRTK